MQVDDAHEFAPHQHGRGEFGAHRDLEGLDHGFRVVKERPQGASGAEAFDLPAAGVSAGLGLLQLLLDPRGDDCPDVHVGPGGGAFLGRQVEGRVRRRDHPPLGATLRPGRGDDLGTPANSNTYG